MLEKLSKLRRGGGDLGDGRSSSLLPDMRFAATMLEMRCNLLAGLDDDDVRRRLKLWDPDVARSKSELGLLPHRILKLWATTMDVSEVSHVRYTTRAMTCACIFITQRVYRSGSCSPCCNNLLCSSDLGKRFQTSASTS